MKHSTNINFLNLNNYIKLFNNFISFGFQVLAGFLMVALIASQLGMEELGVFIQTYTIIVIIGQLSIFGLNDSILKKLSTLKKDTEEKIILNGLIASLINGIIFSLIIFFFGKIIYSYFDSDLLIKSNKYIFLTIFFLVINKSLYSILLGKRFFNFFAIVNFLKPVFIILILLLFIILDFNKVYSLIFLIAEILILFIILIYFDIVRYFKASYVKLNYILEHYNFAFKVFPNGFLSESFIRLDLIMIGLLLEDKFVGIYSLAALFIEGIYQISIVIRNIINPEIGKLYMKNNLQDLIKLIRYSAILSITLTLAVSIFTYIIFSYLLFFVDEDILIQSKYLLMFLLIGIFFYSIIVPSENLLFLSNHPAAQSTYMILLTLLNIIINYFMILKLGLIGAAIGTGIVYFSSILFFNIFIIIFTDLKKGVFLNSKKKN